LLTPCSTAKAISDRYIPQRIINAPPKATPNNEQPSPSPLLAPFASPRHCVRAAPVARLRA